MNKETLNKLRQLHACGAHPSHTQFGELIEIAERSTTPVSQMTDEQIDTVYCEMYEYDPGVVSAPECHLNFARRILAAAAPHAQAPAAQDSKGE